MKSIMLFFISALTTVHFAFAHDEIPGVIAISKATELAIHRIERLVTLKKIDLAFRNHLVSLTSESSTENGATYKVYGFVSPDVDGKSSVITLWMDNNGKTLSYNVTAEKMPANPFTWPSKDSATLFEEGLHFILDGWTQYPEVKAYYVGLKTIAMQPAYDEKGELFADFVATSDDDERVLNIRLKPDGTFVSYSLK